jgi:hypothetical protein
MLFDPVVRALLAQVVPWKVEVEIDPSCVRYCAWVLCAELPLDERTPLTLRYEYSIQGVGFRRVWLATESGDPIVQASSNDVRA